MYFTGIFIISVLIHKAVAVCERQGSFLAAQLAQECQHRFRGIESGHGLAASTSLDPGFKGLGFRLPDNVNENGNGNGNEKTTS